MSSYAPFLIYSPRSTRKLAYFGSEEQLCEELGHDCSGGQDWQPEDRAIDSRGHTYRILYNPTDHFYHIQETSEVWDYSRLLAIALADVRLSKQDTKSLEQRVRDADGGSKHRVIIEAIGVMPDSPSARVLGWVIIALLLGFGVVVFYVVTRLFSWSSKS